MTGPDLSVIVVSFNTRDYLESCLESLERHPCRCSREILVVDNASGDGSAGMVARRFPGVKLIANAENLGFARANNLGLDACGSRYALLLNSDTEVSDGALDALVAFADEHPRAGVVGAQLLYPDGTLQPSGHAVRTRWQELWGFLPFYRLTGGRTEDRFVERGRDYSRSCEVGEVSGAAMLLRREMWDQVGPLDEGFFFGFEDIELCIRARRAGWTVFYCSRAQVIHHWGKSSPREDPAFTRAVLASRFRFYRKVHGRPFEVLMRGLAAAKALAGMAPAAARALAARGGSAGPLGLRTTVLRTSLGLPPRRGRPRA